MPWIKPTWEVGYDILEDWWFASTQYFYNDGDFELPTEYERWTNHLVKFVRDVAKQDPTSFWDVGRLIAEHAHLGNVVGERYPVTLHQIWNAIDRAVILKDWLLVNGVTNRKPAVRGRKKTKTTVRVEELLSDGLDVNAITERIETSAPNVRRIRSNLKRKT